MFEDVKKYLRDNPEGYWFKRKLYGWGWTPVTWQGWLSILVFIILLVGNAFLLDRNDNPTVMEVVWFFVTTVILVGILIAVCYKKGEKPKWQWGAPESLENDNEIKEI